jgi:hypothetical protein
MHIGVQSPLHRLQLRFQLFSFDQRAGAIDLMSRVVHFVLKSIERLINTRKLRVIVVIHLLDHSEFLKVSGFILNLLSEFIWKFA